MAEWAEGFGSSVHAQTFQHLTKLRRAPELADDPEFLRSLLLDFVVEFCNPESGADPLCRRIAQRLVQSAQDTTTGIKGVRPILLDPFAGGGAFPLEFTRLGTDAIASDLNPVAVLLNKVLVEYIPRFGSDLAVAVCTAGAQMKMRAGQRLGRYYPAGSDGAHPIAYFWARTVRCEGPSCGTLIPLLGRQQITKRRRTPIAVFLEKCADGSIRTSVREARRGESIGSGTARGGTVTCPACGATIGEQRYRELGRLGLLGEQLYAVVGRQHGSNERLYRGVEPADIDAFQNAVADAAVLETRWSGRETIYPVEPISEDEPRRLNIRQYGYTDWGSLFNARQKLAIAVLGDLVGEQQSELMASGASREFASAVGAVLALSVSNLTHYMTNQSSYLSDGMISAFIQSSAIAMHADYAEVNPLVEGLVGGFDYQLGKVVELLESLAGYGDNPGIAIRSPADAVPLPTDSVDALITDPPYYYSIPYADLSDLFFVWLKRFLDPTDFPFLDLESTPKAEEATQSLPHSKSPSKKDRQHYESAIRRSFEKGKNLLKPSGIGIVVFAHTSTEGWEALLGGLIEAGWVITAAWPIDTENTSRMLANRQRTLASSVHLVCRPREDGTASPRDSTIGEWREVLAELPPRIQAWMPRLASEGIVGADAIFACLGPALEIYSRYSRVEKASGEAVELREYLEHVWAVVANEALAMIFTGVDAAGFEADARLTAMWLWTLAASGDPATASVRDLVEESSNETASNDAGSSSRKAGGGFSLEYDAARKIAQGLGIHLDRLPDVVEIDGDSAKLLGVSERLHYLFGADANRAKEDAGRRRREVDQGALFELSNFTEKSESEWFGRQEGAIGKTTLDRVHQAMLLFAAGRGEALRRFLVEDGAGTEARFWQLGQALSALYPAGTDERRWVDGVLARKKTLGL